MESCLQYDNRIRIRLLVAVQAEAVATEAEEELEEREAVLEASVGRGLMSSRRSSPSFSSGMCCPTIPAWSPASCKSSGHASGGGTRHS